MKAAEKRRGVAMASECDSPYLSSIENRRIAKPVLSFSRRLIINDENDGAIIIRRTSLKRAESSAMSPSVLGLANKKCRLTPAKSSTINSNTVMALVQTNQELKTSTDSVEQSPTKRKESDAKIMKAVQLSELDPDLIGDFSLPYALPVCSGKHNDLKTITPETLAALLRGQYKDLIDSHTIIDGRYPYEFEGGHIVGARNIYTQPAILRELLDNQQENIGAESATKDGKKRRHILIFHCEFSSERGPNLSRFLRNKDREYNQSRYPLLFHPEVYLLDGGYKAFFEKFKELCTPQSYLPMMSKDHKEQMRICRSKTKSRSFEPGRMSARSEKRRELNG